MKIDKKVTNKFVFPSKNMNNVSTIQGVKRV